MGAAGPDAYRPAGGARRIGFGSAVALSSAGDTALVGAPGTSGESGRPGSSAAVAASWSKGPRLTPAGESGPGVFGRSLALSQDGSTAAVGGPSDGSGTGAVWIFGRSGSQWPAAGEKVVGSGVPVEGQFGWRVALSGDGSTLLVTDHAAFGAAWVFARSGEQWAQQGGQFTDSLEGESNYFGTGGAALSADGNTALIGAPQFLTLGGLAFRFTRSGSAWAQQGAGLEGKEELRPSNFGESVALSADARTALVGGYEAGGIGAAWFFANPPSRARARTAPRLDAQRDRRDAQREHQPGRLGCPRLSLRIRHQRRLWHPGALHPDPRLRHQRAGSRRRRSWAFTPGTAYHFRLAATNAIGTALGTDTTLRDPREPSRRPVGISDRRSHRRWHADHDLGHSS